MDFNRLRGLGDFGNKLIFAPCEMTAESMLPTATMFGLGNSALVIWGTFEDEDGVSYCICREIPGYLSGGCWVMSNVSGDGMRLIGESARLWNGGLIIENDGNRAEWTSADRYRQIEPSFHLLFDNGRAEYRESDLLNITARREATGYQFYEPTHGQGSSNQVYLASGTIAGKAVKGWLGLNPHFQKPGINYRISPMVRDGIMVMWFDVGNIYEDGSWEQGPVIVGRDGYSVAWIVNDQGQVTYSYDIHAEFDLDRDNFATEMRFSYFDARTGEPMKWIWRPKQGSNMVELPALAPHLRNKRSAEGSCIRAGEKRKLRHTSAWPDFQVDERIAAFSQEQRNINLAKFK